MGPGSLLNYSMGIPLLHSVVVEQLQTRQRKFGGPNGGTRILQILMVRMVGVYIQTFLKKS